MRKKHVLLTLASFAVAALIALAWCQYLTVKQISEEVGISIPFTASISTVKSGGMMGGTRETWVAVPQFSALLTQCASNSAFTPGVINYSAFRVATSQFEERGMGKGSGCVKEIKSGASVKLIAIDGGFIYISEQWL